MLPLDSYTYRRVRRTAPWWWWSGVTLLLIALAAWLFTRGSLRPSENERVGQNRSGPDSLSLARVVATADSAALEAATKRIADALAAGRAGRHADAETRDYVPRVQENTARYKALYWTGDHGS